MRLAIDVAQTCVERAGCAWHAHNLATELRNLLQPKDLVLYHDFGNWINSDKSHGTHLAEVAEPFFNLSPLESRETWQAIEKDKRELPGQPDVVISNSFMCPKVNHAKLIYTIHDLCFWTHPSFCTQLNRRTCQSQLLKSLQRADAFVFVSEQSQNDFERYFPSWLEQSGKPTIQVPPIRSRFLPSSFDPDEKFADKHACWLHIGSMEPRKGINDLLDAYEAYYHISSIKRPLRLIGGKGWKSDQIIARIEEMSLRLPIKYSGYVAESERHYWLNQAFALICSSKYEGYGLPVDEAADAGLPIISTPIPSYQKYSSFFIDRQKLDFSNAAKAMAELEKSQSRYESLSNSLRIAAKSTAPGNCTSTLINFYKSVLHLQP